jgi:hypothetical protein
MRRETCEECGARVPEEGDCRDYFDTLLAREWQAPGDEGPLTHFFLVSCYLLQHPKGMGCTVEALEGLRRAVRDALDGKASIDELRRRAAQAEGPIRRRPDDPVPEGYSQAWPMTAADVCAVSSELFQMAVREWARSVCKAVFPGRMGLMDLMDGVS